MLILIGFFVDNLLGNFVVLFKKEQHPLALVLPFPLC